MLNCKFTELYSDEGFYQGVLSSLVSTETNGVIKTWNSSISYCYY